MRGRSGFLSVPHGRYHEKDHFIYSMYVEDGLDFRQSEQSRVHTLQQYSTVPRWRLLPRRGANNSIMLKEI